jgi:anthranilate/para-aminobenzoate synthase component II
LDDFNSLPQLHSFFKLLSIDTAVDGRTFISGLEAKEHPIFALMYHPEY